MTFRARAGFAGPILVLLQSGLWCAGALAQSPEPAAIVEIGAAPGWDLKDGGWSAGPTVAVEFTPVENWLEIEIGVTPGFGHGATEWGTDFLFKKPWTLSRKVEFMAGMGPEWLHSRVRGVAMNSVAAEAVLDFMLWPSVKRRFGWYFEPGYEYGFGAAHERSFGISGGVLIAIR